MSAAAPTLNIEGDRVRVPAAAFELEGFRAWATSSDFPEGVRACFVRGEVFLEMSPESIESHNKVKQAITAALVVLAREEDLGEVYSDGVLLSHPAAGLSTEPDLAFASWAALDAGRMRLVHKANRMDEFVEVEGTPDLVVEVVSDSSVRKDLQVLRGSYFNAGVAEYWIVDARGEPLEFTILTRSADDYEPASPPGAPQRSDVLQRSFALERSRNRVGRWVYRLRAC